MWRRQREDDGRLQSVIQFLRMTGTENCFRYPVVVAPVVVLKVSIGFVADLLFSTLESGFKKYPDSLPSSRDACGQKPYSGRKSCRFKNTLLRVDGV